MQAKASIGIAADSLKPLPRGVAGRDNAQAAVTLDIERGNDLGKALLTHKI